MLLSVRQAEGLCKSCPDNWIYHRWVKGWIAHYIHASPHKDISTWISVCVAVSHNHPRGDERHYGLLKCTTALLINDQTQDYMIVQGYKKIYL